MRSQFCTYERIITEDAQKWATELGYPNSLHRKVWEYIFICQALDKYGFLKQGKSGLGFAVGTEPLASLFASYGVSIVATDLDTDEAVEKGWQKTNEHAKNKEALNTRGLCEEKLFDKLVEFEFADMNSIPDHFDESFDFTWSACAFEHLGTLDKGIDFVCNSVKCLKPGGIAVHTTEYNVCSNSKTIEEGGTVIYRKQDLQRLVKKVRSLGYLIDDIDWDLGTSPVDYHIDIPPYKQNPHLKLQLLGYTTTSVGLIVHKPML